MSLRRRRATPAEGPKRPRFLFWEVSPLTRRRIDQFRQNRRGFWSLMIFVGIFAGTWLAEGFANDKPLLIELGGQRYYPILERYSERDFGGVFPTQPDYRERYFAQLIDEQGGRMIWPPIRFHHSTIDKLLPPGVSAPAPPSRQHWLGTDEAARDVVARLIYGIRESIVFALVLTLSSSVIGIAAGAVQGYYGGWVDLLFQRLIEVWGAIPFLYVVIIISSLVVPNLLWLIVILLFFTWTSLVGLVRAEFLRVRNFEYVKAARALGVRDRVIIVRHVLPNAMVSTITFLPFIMSGAVVSLTSLDFLGYGLSPEDYARLGELLNQGKNNTQAPWLAFSSFFTIAFMLTLLVFVGEAVRDAFDPRKTLV
ncbi:MAG: ABC transporter permease [Caldilineae bacterium]|nr:ABC transporter permease [Chloroflexota bacterium]MCB9176753.1 ABC transporter permease [Caldilineae bacterium]